MILLVLAATIPNSISGATGEEPIPYIEIEYPKDGSTVDTRTTLVVTAKGNDLKNPTLSVSGEAAGFSGPITGCIFGETSEPAVPENEMTASDTEAPVETTGSMHCKQELDLGSFDGERVKVSVSVNEGSDLLTDSVGLYVSGHRA